MTLLGSSRIHLNVERWRVCEAWFSPAMAGVDSAGLGEVLQTMLARFPNSDKERLVRVGDRSLCTRQIS
jgi:actin-related protein 5